MSLISKESNIVHSVLQYSLNFIPEFMPHVPVCVWTQISKLRQWSHMVISEFMFRSMARKIAIITSSKENSENYKNSHRSFLD